MLVADILKRFAVLRGQRAFLLTGTDEHGMKVRAPTLALVLRGGAN
jgi:methionyl-tRNA synthetase